MTNEEKELVENNIKLAYKLASIYHKKLNGFIELEELQSIAFLGLSKAAKTFDKSKHVEFSTYAYRVMQNEIIYTTSKNKNMQTISLSQQVYDDVNLEDTLHSDFDLEGEVDKNIKIKMLYEFISKMDELDSNILTLYLQGLTLKQISIKLGFRESYIGEKYRKAINKLRCKFYKEMGGDI